MSSVDERIVQMKFDNKQFESGVASTNASLGKLKQGLNLEGATRGLADLQKIGHGFSLAGISTGVDTLVSKFSILGIAGITAIQSITNSAIASGKRIVNALTLEPVMTGFQEYELKMGAIQTIMSGSGESLQVVNKALKELNTYSDKTIYSFKDMTSNIGKFTNAGVNLKDSVAAIKGISNVAAISGANAEEASRAMYNFAQAISSGSVKLMDWKSIEYANMATKEFKTQLMDSAVAAGTLKKNAKGMYTTLKGTPITATKGFNQSLAEQWLTTESLVKTLKDYADNTTEIGKKAFAAAQDVKTLTQLYGTMKEAVQSGWAESWENIIGDKNEAVKLWTGVNNTFGAIVGKSADARNAILSFWKANGGRDALIKALANAFHGLEGVIKPIGEAFRTIFPPMTGEKLVAITKSFMTLTENFKMGAETSEKLKKTFSGLFAILDMGRMLFSGIAGVAWDVLKSLAPLGSGILSITASLGAAITRVRDAMKQSAGMQEFITKVKELFRPAIEVVQTMIKTLAQGLEDLGNIDTTSLEDFSKKMEIAFAPVIALGKILMGMITRVFPLIATAFDIVGTTVVKMFDKIGAELKNMSFDTIISILNGAFLMGLLASISKFVKKLTDITGGGGDLLKNVTGILDGVGKSLQAYQQNLQAKTLLTIAGSIAILAASLIALSMLDGPKLEQSLEALSVLFAQMFAASGIFGKMLSGVQLLSSIQSILVINGMATAILLLAGALKEISGISWEGIAKGVVAMSAITAILAVAAKTIKFPKKMAGTVLGILAFAVAIRILVTAVKSLSTLNVGELTKGLVGIGIILTELALFLKVAKFDKIGPTSTIGLIALAVALNILAVAVKQFGSMNIKVLSQGLVAIGIVLTELVIFTQKTSNAKSVILTAIGLTILGVALMLFGRSIAQMGNLPLDVIAKGLLAMGGALAIVAAGMKLMPSNLILMGIGLTGVGIAVNVLALALERFGNMSLAEIAKGLLALGASLGILAAGMALMTTGLPGAVAMLVMSAALAIFVPVLALLSSIPFMGIVVGLVAIAGAFAIIGVAALILTPILGSVMLLGAAMALLGVGFLAMGAGVTLFGTGLALVANGLGLFIAAITAALPNVLKMIPTLIKIIIETIKGFAKILKEAAPALVESIVILIDSLLKAIQLSVPKIVSLFIKLVINILYQLAAAVPKIVVLGGNIIVGLLNGIAKKLPEIINAGANIIVNFLKGIAANIGKIVTTAIMIGINFIKGITSMLPKIIQTGFNLIIAFINGLANAIRNNTNTLIRAFANLMNAVIGAGTKTLWASISSFLNIGSKLMSNGFIRGVGTKIGAFASTLGDMLSRGVRALGAGASSFARAGQNLIDGFINGIKSKINLAASWASSLASSVLNAAKRVLGIKSPSKEFAMLGMYAVQGFANGLKDFTGVAVASAKNVGTEAISALQNTVSQISDAVSNGMDVSPVIRPVLDLTNIQNGSKVLTSLLDSNKSISMATAISQSTTPVNTGTDIKGALVDLKGMFKGALDNLKETAPQINFNGQYSFSGQTDIDYFMNQAALLIDRRKS